MSNDAGCLIYRIDAELWIGLGDEYEKDTLNGKANEVLDMTENLLVLEDESKISLFEYINDLISSDCLTKEMIPCSLGTFLEEKIELKDNKRQWRVLFTDIGA
ncbi:hypothetical protein AMD27_17680 (plasmid) [Acinetobacter sp. TGL-Y2]|uniref:hypothetical protein n=1 Tax=Acinetobacter sp. TGL-Y2 TaxID=1407071 RepID=UPI0007A667BF|nr:hypothetical protein [Acinetobacter sp. TGL-Y2]AMW80747.1 hypothetical protein AMD27_17680 [Acinetobacter sp. TGL-Y2]